MSREPSSPHVERFTTDDAPPREQFDAWSVEVPFFDFAPDDDARNAFDMQCQHVSFGPFVLENRVWRHPSSTARLSAERTARHVRADQHDYFCFNLQVQGTLALRTRSMSHTKRAGDLYLLDYGRPFEFIAASGHEIALAAPRALLPPSLARLHGYSFTEGASTLLRAHLLSLRENLPTLSAAEIPYVADATTQLLLACARSAPDGLPESNGVVEALLGQRVRRYIDTHLLDAGLTPDRICRDAGLSRAKLYQLFADAGGVMREVRRRRLALAHQSLANGHGRREKIRALALRHGFTDEKYFSRVFRAQYGYAPSETYERINSGRKG